jgi:hypothetical protein
MGDFGSATEAMRIIDLFALQVFAKNLDRCNFRVLQHNRHFSDLPDLADDVRSLCDREDMIWDTQPSSPARRMP